MNRNSNKMESDQTVNRHVTLNTQYPLLSNVHSVIDPPGPGDSYSVRGNVLFYHYGCDGHNDAGWGCAYRTLQSMLSWIFDKQAKKAGPTIPSIAEIQQILVTIGDKTSQFVGSKNWIGAVELSYVIDYLCDIPCKIVHIPRDQDLKTHINSIKNYFELFGGFVMMGGDMDASSKGIAGVHINNKNDDAYLLIVDPHYLGIPKSPRELIEKGYIRWQHISEFVDSSFYNLCMPQLK